MTSDIVQLRGQQTIKHNTYGAGQESDITALEALLSEVRRTHAHIMWLEQYIARLPEWSVFQDNSVTMVDEAESQQIGTPTANAIKYHLAVERQRRLRGTVTKPGVHPAVTQLLRERQQLVSACGMAIRAGVALDAIEMAKSQGALLVEAMKTFAIETGQDVSDINVIRAMTSALEKAMARTEQAAVM